MSVDPKTARQVLEEGGVKIGGWLPIDLCPIDGVDRMLRLSDGREVIGRYCMHLGRSDGWMTATPVEYDSPVYEYTFRGGFVPLGDQYKARPDPDVKQIGTRKEVMWLIGKLPDDVFPTHFRPNDTVYGDPKAAKST